MIAISLSRSPRASLLRLTTSRVLHNTGRISIRNFSATWDANVSEAHAQQSPAQQTKTRPPSRVARREKRAHLRASWESGQGLQGVAFSEKRGIDMSSAASLPPPPPPPTQSPQSSQNQTKTKLSNKEMKRQDKWRSFGRASEAPSTGAGASIPTSWPNAHKPFLRQLQEYLSDTTLPIFAPHTQASPVLAEDASQRLRAISQELTRRAPQLGVGMIASVFNTIARSRDVAMSNYRKNRNGAAAATSDQRDINLRLKKDFHPALTQLLAHFVRMLVSELEPAANTNTSSYTKNRVDRGNIHSLGHGHNSNQGKRAYRAAALEKVTFGLQRVGMRWENLQHLGDSLLQAMLATIPHSAASQQASALPAVGNSPSGDTHIPTADLSRHCLTLLYPNTLTNLGRMGLTWYAIPAAHPSLHSGISCTYESLLQEKLSSLTMEKQKGHALNNSSSTNNADGDIDGTTGSNDTAPGNKHSGSQVQHILQAVAEIGLSLRPEEMPPSLAHILHQCVQHEAVTMAPSTLAKTCVLLGKTSSRGMYLLPSDTRRAIFARLTKVHLDLYPGSRDAASHGQPGTQDILWALGSCGGSDQWEIITPTQREMLILMTSLAVAKSAKPHMMMSMCGNALARMGAKLSLTSTSEYEQHLLHMLLNVEFDENKHRSEGEGGIGVLTMHLLALAKLIAHTHPVSTSNGEHVFENDLQLQLQKRIAIACDELAQHLEDTVTGAYLNEKQLMNSLWALGEIGMHWDHMPVRLRKACYNALTKAYGRAAEFAEEEPTAERYAVTDHMDLSSSGYPEPAASHSTHGAEDRHSPAGSTLVHLGRHGRSSLDTSMGKVASFRQLLFPLSGDIAGNTIYNYYGALASARIPINALPADFTTSLFVALTEDLSMQGPSTVAHVAELLARCGACFETEDPSGHATNNLGRSSSSSSSPSDSDSNLNTLPHYVTEALVAQLAKKASSMTPEYLTRTLGAMSGVSTALHAHLQQTSGEVTNGASLSSDIPSLVCGDNNVILSRRLCNALTDSLLRHTTLVQNGHSVTKSFSSGGKENAIAANADNSGLFTLEQLLLLVSSVQELTFCVTADRPSSDTMNHKLIGEVQNMHFQILNALVSLSDEDLSCLIRSHIGSAGRLLGLCQYLSLSQKDAIMLLEMQDLHGQYDAQSHDYYRDGSGSNDADDLYSCNGRHGQTAVTAFPMLAKEAAALSSRLLRAASL